MRINQEAQEIMVAFDRYIESGDRSEFEHYALAQLRSTDEQYGDRNLERSGRKALLNRIHELEEKDRCHDAESLRRREWFIALVSGTASGVISAIIVTWLLKS